MQYKRILIGFVLSLLAASTGCSQKDTGGDLKLPALQLKNITYEASSFSADTDPDISVGTASSVKTGETFRATLNAANSTGKTLYFIMDWGDGTWSYDGPYSGGVSCSMQHAYRNAGQYSVRGMSVNLDGGIRSGYSKPRVVTATGGTVQGGYITTVKPISSGSASGEYAEQNIVDNKSTFWRSTPEKNVEAEQWVGLRLDTMYRLDSVEIKIPRDAKLFPQNLSIEYTTDGGTVWYSLPKYYYRYDYKEASYSPIMGFPNPAGATLVLPLDGIVANGIRICSKLYPLEDLQSPKYFEVEEMRVIGDKRLLYYSSRGGQFDADLNNLYTIF